MQRIDFFVSPLYILQHPLYKENVVTKYQHKKGVIRDNALKALLHDPLFRIRTEVNQKGKGSYRRKDKYGKKGNWEASGKESFTTGLPLLKA